MNYNYGVDSFAREFTLRGGEGVACAKEVGVRSGGAGESRGVVGNPAAVSALSAVDGRVLAYHACLDGTRQREGGH